MPDWIQAAAAVIMLVLTLGSGYLILLSRTQAAEQRNQAVEQRATRELLEQKLAAIERRLESVEENQHERLTAVAEEVRKLRDWRHDIAGKLMVHDSYGEKIEAVDKRLGGRIDDLDERLRRHVERNERGGVK